MNYVTAYPQFAQDPDIINLMQDLIQKIEELRKSLAAMKPKENPLVPALNLPPVKPLSISASGGSSVKPPKLPGVAPASGKDPKKMAQQLKNPRPKAPKVEVLKTDKNGQWSLDKGEEDKIHVSTTVRDLPLKGHAVLVDPEGNVRAKFYDGNPIGNIPTVDSDEPTKDMSKQ